MARINVDQIAVLEAVVARLISQISEFDANSCFISLDPIPIPIPTQPLFCTVGITESSFDQGIIEGGGQAACAEDSGVIVTVANRVMLDKVHTHKVALEESARGLLTFKKKILKALVSHDLLSGSDTFLRNLMMPLSGAAPGSNAKDRINWISVVFSTDFDWDLS